MCRQRRVKSSGCSRAAGGTGRRARLRGVWGNPSGFESRVAHQAGASGATSRALRLFRNTEFHGFGAESGRGLYRRGCIATRRRQTFGAVGRQPSIPLELRSGIFTVEEARLAGLSKEQLAGASWLRVERGIYRWAKLEVGPMEQLIAVARRMPAAVFSGRTAGWLHGLDLPPVNPVEVILQDFHASSRAGVKLQRTTLLRGDVIQRRGLSVTSGLRTAVDLGSRTPLVDGVVALDMALHRRIVSLTKLRSFCEAARGAKGAARLRRAVALSPRRNRQWKHGCGCF